MTDLASRIRIAAAKGGGLKWLSNEIGVPRRTLGNWLAGRNPKPEALRKVAGATGVNLHWLITGEGDPEDDNIVVALRKMGHEMPSPEMRPDDELQDEATEKFNRAMERFSSAADEVSQAVAKASEVVRETFEPPLAPTIKFLPLKASAGGGSAVLFESRGIDLDMDALAAKVLGARRKHIRLLEIKGDSMLPTLAHGDFAVIDTSQPRAGEDPENDKVYVVSINGDLYAKRALWLDHETIQWRSDNDLPEHPPIDVQGEDMNRVKVIGRVIWSWKPV